MSFVVSLCPSGSLSEEWILVVAKLPTVYSFPSIKGLVGKSLNDSISILKRFSISHTL